jgi:hypothetical protein
VFPSGASRADRANEVLSRSWQLGVRKGRPRGCCPSCGSVLGSRFLPAPPILTSRRRHAACQAGEKAVHPQPAGTKIERIDVSSGDEILVSVEKRCAEYHTSGAPSERGSSPAPSRMVHLDHPSPKFELARRSGGKIRIRIRIRPRCWTNRSSPSRRLGTRAAWPEKRCEGG